MKVKDDVTSSYLHRTSILHPVFECKNAYVCSGRIQVDRAAVKRAEVGITFNTAIGMAMAYDGQLLSIGTSPDLTQDASGK